MSDKQSGLLTTMAPVIFSLLIGGIGGYYLHGLNGVTSPATAAPASAAGDAMPRGGGGMGGGMGRGGGGMGGGPASGANALPRLIRNMATMEKVQNQGLNAGQAMKLLPILQQLQSADRLPEKEREARTSEVEAILTGSQKQALQALQPTRPGGGMRGGTGGGMGGGMMGGGMGGGQDPDRPFASERNKQALTDLITSLQHVKT
jgi:hypothetical protein